MFVENIPVMTRQEARDKNLKKYFTGTPCKWGHLSPKTTAQSRCATCAAQSGDKEKRKRWVMRADYAPSGVLDVDDWAREHRLFKEAKSRHQGLLYRTSEEGWKRTPTYKGVTLCEEWKKFQPFFEWYVENIVNDSDHIDKGLLQRFVKNKVYSPGTCLMMPHSVNYSISMREVCAKFKDKKYMGGYSRRTYESVKGKGTSTYYRAVITNTKGDPVHVGNYKTEYEAHSAWRSKKIERFRDLINEYKDKYPRITEELGMVIEEMREDERMNRPTDWA